LNVTAQQRLLLRCIGKYPGVTAGHLADILCLDPGTISASIKRLESRGLLERRRDPKDKRRVTLGLTLEGHRLALPAERTVESAVEGLLSKTPGKDVATIIRVLENLSGLLESVEGRPDSNQ
jgi:MarR family transcriptional regulator, organic hydroperoxide resistance regulator